MVYRSPRSRRKRFAGSATIRFPTRRSTPRYESASYSQACGRIINNGGATLCGADELRTGFSSARQSLAPPARIIRSANPLMDLFLHDFGVFEHDHAAALGDFAF